MNLFKIFNKVKDSDNGRKHFLDIKSSNSPLIAISSKFDFDDDFVLCTSDNYFEFLDDSDDDVISDSSVTDSISDVIASDKKGGVITFSTDINAVRLSENRLINFLKQKVSSIVNRFLVNKKTTKLLEANEDIYAWSIGNFFKGRYKDRNGKVFDETSISIQILGIDSKTLCKVAEGICDTFRQECVMVLDFDGNKVYFIDATESSYDEDEFKKFDNKEQVEDTLKDAIKFATKVIESDEDEMTDEEMDEAVEDFDEIQDSYSDNDDDVVANNICLMLENNDGNFYNSLFNALVKKAKRGVKLSAEKLANSSVVMNQSRKMRKELNEMNEDSNYATMSDDKKGRLMFAQNLIENVGYEVERLNEKQ